LGSAREVSLKPVESVAGDTHVGEDGEEKMMVNTVKSTAKIKEDENCDSSRVHGVESEVVDVGEG
jgi:hypothetical protein